MRLSVNQKVTEAVTFNIFTLIVWSPVMLLLGMSFSALPLDRLTNFALSTIAVFFQDKLRIPRKPLPNRTWREQVVRPLAGVGELFVLQGLFYLPVMLVFGVDWPDTIIGLVNLLGGSVTLWIWQEKFRWIALVWERGRRRVATRLSGLHDFLSRQMENLKRGG